jgi:hypothetical protein
LSLSQIQWCWQVTAADSLLQGEAAPPADGRLAGLAEEPKESAHEPGPGLMSPEFVAAANQAAGTLPICNSTASRMAMPMRLRRRRI